MMKLKLKITVLLLLISCFFYAQNFQVLYKVTFKPSNESTEFKIEYMNLEIMKDESVFYNAKLIKPNSQEQEKDFLRFFIKQKGGSSWYYGSLNDLYFKYKEPSTKEWILSKKADTLKGYIVQEAEIFFEGRQWKAIFTKDIPIFGTI